MKSANNSEADVDFARRVSRVVLDNSALAVNTLWAKLDDKARFHIAVCIGYFIGRKSDKTVVDQRRKRGMDIQRALSKQITLLRGTREKRIAFEEMKQMPFGTVSVFRGPIWPQGSVTLSTILSEELIRLNTLVKEVKRLYNVKRLGLSGEHYWLVLAQEFLSSWSSRQLGETLKLTPTHLAELIDAAFASTDLKRNDPTDPENLRKALNNFRGNPGNQYFCKHASDMVSLWN